MFIMTEVCDCLYLVEKPDTTGVKTYIINYSQGNNSYIHNVIFPIKILF